MELRNAHGHGPRYGGARSPYRPHGARQGIANQIAAFARAGRWQGIRVDLGGSGSHGQPVGLLVNRAAMAHRDDQHNELMILNLANYPKVANPVAPQAGELGCQTFATLS